MVTHIPPRPGYPIPSPNSIQSFSSWKVSQLSAQWRHLLQYKPPGQCLISYMVLPDHSLLDQATQEAVCLSVYRLNSHNQCTSVRGSPTHLVLIQSSRGGTRSLQLSSGAVLVVSRKEREKECVISGICTDPAASMGNSGGPPQPLGMTDPSSS